MEPKNEGLGQMMFLFKIRGDVQVPAVQIR